MFKWGNKLRLKKDMKFKKGEESVTLWGSDDWPSKITLVCIADQKDEYVDVTGPGLSGAHLLAERLRLETSDDFD